MADDESNVTELRPANTTAVELDDLPVPPFPDPANPLLRVVIERATGAWAAREWTAEAAITWAAVNAWREGHIEGEDGCEGCGG